MSSYLISALGKVIFVIIVLAIWNVFVADEAAKLATAAQWFLSQSVYPMLTYDAASFILDTAIFFTTLKLFMWIVLPGAHDTGGAEGDGPDTARRGFTTRSLYND
jgi:hypothetical protein